MWFACVSDQMKSSGKPSFHLPDNIVSRIFSFLDGRGVAQMALVSKQWAEVCSSDSKLWQTIVTNEFGQLNPSSTSWRDVYIHENNWLRREFGRRVFRGHRGDVKCLQFNSREVFSGSDDCTIRIWDMETGESKGVLTPDLGGIFALKYDDEIILAGGSQARIGVYDKATYRPLQTLTGHEDWVTCLDFNGGNAVSGSHDTFLKLWDIETSQTLQTLKGHEDWVRCLQIAGHRLLSGSSDQSLRMWDTRLPECVQIFEGHNDCVTSLQFDDHKIISTTARNRMKMWDLRTGACLHTFDTSSAVCVRFDESKVVCGRHLNGFILIFDLRTLEWRRMLQGPHYLCSWCLEFDKKNIVCGGGSDIEVWSLGEAALEPFKDLSINRMQMWPSA